MGLLAVLCVCMAVLTAGVPLPEGAQSNLQVQGVKLVRSATSSSPTDSQSGDHIMHHESAKRRELISLGVHTPRVQSSGDGVLVGEDVLSSGDVAISIEGSNETREPMSPVAESSASTQTTASTENAHKSLLETLPPAPAQETQPTQTSSVTPYTQAASNVDVSDPSPPYPASMASHGPIANLVPSSPSSNTLPNEMVPKAILSSTSVSDIVSENMKKSGLTTTDIRVDGPKKKPFTKSHSTTKPRGQAKSKSTKPFHSKKVELLKHDSHSTPQEQEHKKVAPIGSSQSNMQGGFDVDVVFTWYNSNDQESEKQRQMYLAESDPAHRTVGSSDAKRFVDMGEMRYALRSVSVNAPWIRTLHLVVADSQALPTWLNATAPNLNVVRHSTIFPDTSVLPTFSSYAIESCVHRIPGLAESFIYLNDDMFLGQPMTRDQFFAQDGVPNVWLQAPNVDPSNKALVQSMDPYAAQVFMPPANKGDDSYVTAIKNSNQLISTLPHLAEPSMLYLSLKHQAKPLSVSWMKEAESKFADAFRITRASRFRSPNDIWPMQVGSALCLQAGECPHPAAPAEKYYRFSSTPLALLSTVEKDHASLFCINDGVGNKKVARQFAQGMSKLFPAMSGFELKL